MPRYAISFDLDRKSMVKDGYTESQINNDVYSGEVQDALAACGFTEHPEGSVYHTKTLAEDDSLTPVVQLQLILKQKAPTFCRYVRSIHLFKMEGWSNITKMIHTNDESAANFMKPKGEPKVQPAAAATPAKTSTAVTAGS